LHFQPKLSILVPTMDRRFEEGVKLFNREEFFDAHEVWEDLWHEYRETDRTFLQGLIQAAAGLYHAQCGNERGAISQISKAIAKLTQYVPKHWSVDTDGLIRSLHEWLEDPGTKNEYRPQRPFPTVKTDDEPSTP